MAIAARLEGISTEIRGAGLPGEQRTRQEDHRADFARRGLELLYRSRRRATSSHTSCRSRKAALDRRAPSAREIRHHLVRGTGPAHGARAHLCGSDPLVWSRGDLDALTPQLYPADAPTRARVRRRLGVMPRRRHGAARFQRERTAIACSTLAVTPRWGALALHHARPVPPAEVAAHGRSSRTSPA